MGIHDRDYYRQSTPFGRLAEWGLYQLTPVVKWLIIANVAVFLLQILKWLERGLRLARPEVCLHAGSQSRARNRQRRGCERERPHLDLPLRNRHAHVIAFNARPSGTPPPMS